MIEQARLRASTRFFALLGAAVLIPAAAVAGPPQFKKPGPSGAKPGIVKVTPPPAPSGSPSSVRVTPPPRAEFDLSLMALQVQPSVARGKLGSVLTSVTIKNNGTRRWGFADTATFALSEGLPGPSQRPAIRVRMESTSGGLEPGGLVKVPADVQKTVVVRAFKAAPREAGAPLDLPLNRYYTLYVELAAREDQRPRNNALGVAFFVDAAGRASQVREFSPGPDGQPRWIDTAAAAAPGADGASSDEAARERARATALEALRGG